ncbi:MAG: POTRA domain-containing protein [Ferruginibacter sp.]
MKFFALKYTPGKYLKTLFLNPFHSLFIISVILVFVCIFSTKTQAQRLPVGFYDEIEKKVLVDSSAKIYISSIKITGNKKTKKYLIEREMRLKTGDSSFAASLYEKLTRSQELIYNTNLFTEVTLVPFFNTATDVSIYVTVKEKWYIYPTPQFQLVDRNFNEWLNLSNGSLDRVIYGAKYAHYNLSGRRDQLRVYLLNGYARNLSFSYTAPYSNKTLTEGFSLAAGYTQNREITYKTSSDNLPLRYQNDGFVRNSFTTSASYIMRKGYYRKHIFSISYSNLNVDDSITNFYNKAYFNTKKNHVGYPEAVYTYQYSNTNNINYPLKGKIYSLII